MAQYFKSNNLIGATALMLFIAHFISGCYFQFSNMEIVVSGHIWLVINSLEILVLFMAGYYMLKRGMVCFEAVFSMIMGLVMGVYVLLNHLIIENGLSRTAWLPVDILMVFVLLISSRKILNN